MLIKGSGASEKTSILVDNYAKLLNSGVDSSKILVLVQNSNKKNDFINQTLDKLTVDCIEKLQVYSFFGLVYNTVSDNWAYIENKIKNEENVSILPNLVGLEVSQFIMKEVLSEVKFEGYNSKKSLLHQLFRRYSLIVQNHLSDEEVQKRSEILKEGFAQDAKKALDSFKNKTLSLRSLDYLRQSLIFNHIYESTDCFSQIEYLIVDDADEITPICFDFLKHLSGQLKDVFIAYDPKGASRCGYLSANKQAVYEFEKVFNQNSIVLAENSKLANDAETIFNNVIEQKADKLNNFSITSVSKRAQMIDSAVQRAKSLIKKGVAPSDIAIITPTVDDMMKFCLKENLKSNFAEPLFLSGSEKLVQNPIVLSTLCILKLSNPYMKKTLSEFDIRSVLTDFLQIPLKYCKEILENFENTNNLVEFKFEQEDYSKIYAKFLSLLKKISEKQMKLSEQVYDIAEELINYENYKFEEITKFNFFIKQLEDFESVYSEQFLNEKKSDIIIQIENSIISENPYSTLEIRQNDLIVATPQKIIDNQIKTKYQIWLDISSDEWVKSDTGPLYNAWVMQSGWQKPEYTLYDNIELSRQKTARILRKLSLCAEEKIYVYASLFDSNGVENYGGIEKYLKYEGEPEDLSFSKPIKKIIPRDDQKPILDYSSGKMAISAVPGAGKTTILLALILKLLDDGVNPENIFVLTYMDSAARNFRERIQNTRQNFSQLPNISTIHGLALKILKDNSNFERLELSEDFEICDDTQRSRILKEISAKLKIKPKELEDFDRAISALKMSTNNTLPHDPSLSRKEESGIKVPNADKKITSFLEFFNEYQSILKFNNLIDYDDMLLFSVKLLEENPDILAYYQELCQYVIEDEAQDSSSIQQKLINLLSAKYKNLIRCGDINQAITTTFSNADVEGFRDFITKSENIINMNCSQRCTEEVWKLANNLVSFSEKTQHSKNAFFKIFMKPVEDKNPKVEKGEMPVSAITFENEFAEKNYILKQIKNYLIKNPKATFGILLRSNYQVGKWTNFINNSGLKSITRSECLEQKGVFRTIFAILQIIKNPFDNENIAKNYDILSELGHYKTNLFSEIKNYPCSFIEESADNIKNLDLVDLYWDLIYWLSFSSLPIEELAIKIGLYYYQTEVEKSNVYLIATIIKRLSGSDKNFSSILQKLSDISKKSSLSGYKFFSEEESSDRAFLAGKIQIMTMHKSKGDEFDYVILPEMSEKNLNMDFHTMNLKANVRFMENIRELNPKYQPKSDDQLKEFLLAENLRLFYVAITRAKRKLLITSSINTNSFGKTIQQEPSIIFKTLLKSSFLEESISE